MRAQQISRLEAALSKAKEEINELRAKNLETELKASELTKAGREKVAEAVVAAKAKIKELIKDEA